MLRQYDLSTRCDRRWKAGISEYHFSESAVFASVTVDTSDHLLLLSTCTSDATNGDTLVGVIREAASAYGIKDEGERENEP